MARILLIHWHEAEAAAHAQPLRDMGYAVECLWQDGGAWKPDREQPPQAVIVSLDRLPSHGKAFAEWFREAKWRRSIPLLFVGGATEKQAALRERFPDATFLNWPALAHELRQRTAEHPSVVNERTEP